MSSELTESHIFRSRTYPISKSSPTVGHFGGDQQASSTTTSGSRKIHFHLLFSNGITRLILIAAIVFCLAACSREREPTPDIEATVLAAVAMAVPSPSPTSTPDAEATIAAKVQATVEPTFPRSAAWERRNPVRVLPI